MPFDIEVAVDPEMLGKVFEDLVTGRHDSGVLMLRSGGAAKQRPLVRLVERILEAKAADPDADTSELEAQIDRLVYDLYGLTEAETTAVERSLGLIHATDEEEDAALLKIAEESDPCGPEDFVTEEEVRGTLRAIDGC